MANFWENDAVVGGGGNVAPAAAPGNFWEADTVVQPATAKPEAWNPALGLSRDVLNGIPILGPAYTGAVDAITTNIAGMLTGEDPQSIKDRVYARQDAYEAENPILSATGQIVGGTLAMAPLAATAAGAKAFGVGTGALLPRVLAATGSNGMLTFGDSLARGDDLSTAAVKGSIGAVVGGGGASVAPYVTAAGGKAADLARAMFGMPRAPGNTGLSAPAADILTHVANADGTLGNQAAMNMSAAGPRAMMVDASPGYAGLLDTAISRSGAGSKAALDAIDARAVGANGDIGTALDTALGQPRGVYTAGNTIRTSTAAPRQAAYDAAYASPIDYSSDAGRQIEQLVTRVPASVIKTANQMMLMEGQQSAQILAQVADDGAVTFMKMPDVRQIDYITRALNTMASLGENRGAMGAATDLSRLYGNLSRDIRGATKEAAPAYANALQTAAHPIQERQALMFGADILNPSMARDQVQDVVQNMTGPERQAAMQGLRSHVDEVIANVKAAVSNPNIDAAQARKALQDLSSPAARAKIEMLLGDQAMATDLFQQLDYATRSLGLRAGVASNSRTFGRTSMDQIVEALTDTTFGRLTQGKPLDASRRAIQAALGTTPKDQLARKERVYAEIVQALMAQPDKGMDLISGLGHRQQAGGKPGAATVLPGASQAVADAIYRSLVNQ